MSFAGSSLPATEEGTEQDGTVMTQEGMEHGSARRLPHFRGSVKECPRALNVCVCVTLGVIGMLLHLFYCRGTQHFTGTVSNEATSEMGYPAWPAGRTCEFSFLSAWHEAKPRTSLGRQVRPSSLCRFVVALRLWPLFLLRPPGSDGPYWYS